MATPAVERPHPVQLRLTLWTDRPEVARRADAAGVDRIGIDLERHGKRARQAGLGTWISPHEASALPGLRAALRRSALFVRCDPWHAGSPAQVEAVLAAGAEVLMLPMWRTSDEVRAFVHAVDGRATVVPLLETAGALECLPEVLTLSAIDEIHIGLNDLSLDLGLANRFATLLAPAVRRAADQIRGAGVALAVGGVGPVDAAGLPVPSELIYGALAALGATGALLSRSFLREAGDLATDVLRARAYFAACAARTPDEHAASAGRLRDAVAATPVW